MFYDNDYIFTAIVEKANLLPIFLIAFAVSIFLLVNCT